MGIGDITLLDASQEMLQIAKEKLDKAINTNTAHIVQATLPDLPFQGNDFDAVMFNNVSYEYTFWQAYLIYRGYSIVFVECGFYVIE